MGKIINNIITMGLTIVNNSNKIIHKTITVNINI